MSSNPVFQDIYGAIAHILCGISNSAQVDTVERLELEVDTRALEECRDYLFQVAVGCFN